MAVNIGVAALSEAIRVGDSSAEHAEVTRLLAFATTAISRHLGDAYATAPDEVVNEACVRYCGFLYDQPTASRGRAFSNALVNSGAAAILLPYREIGGTRLGKGEAAASTSTSGTTPSPSGPAVDQVARDAASNAAILARNAQTTADAAAQGVLGNEMAIQDKQDTLMPPSTAEADKGTATTIRGWTAALVRRVAESVFNSAIQNAVQLWARAAPANANAEGERYYPAADDLAKDSTHGDLLTAHRNGSTFWDSPNDIPTVVQISPAVIDKNNIPAGFRVQMLNRSDTFPAATKMRASLAGIKSPLFPYEPAVHFHSLYMIMTASLKTAIGALTVHQPALLLIELLDNSDQVIGQAEPVSLQVIEGSTGTSKAEPLTTVQQIGLLNMIPEPSGIVFADADALTKAVKTIKLHIPNPGILTGETWYEGEIQGQPALARTKWATNKTLATLTLSDALAGQVSQAIFNDSDLEVRLRFFDAASAGNEIEQIGVNIPLVKVPEASSGGATIQRFNIRFDKTTYAYQTATQLGGQVGQWSMTAPYPSGLTRDTAIAGMKTAALNHFTMGEFGVAFVEFSNQKLFGHNPNSDFSDRMDIDFEAANVKLTVPTDTQLTDAEKNNWSARLSMVS